MGFLAVLSMFFGVAAQAFEAYPEFSGLTERESERLESPRLIDSEYQSDVLTFSRTFRQEDRWLAEKQGVALSLGSLGAKNFYIDERAKINQPLSPWIDFRFTHFKQGDFERDEDHNIIELVFKATNKMGFSVYGEPSMRKAEDDLGVALLFWPTAEQEIRLFYTEVDFSRNQRNDRNDRFSRKPWTAGLLGRWVSSGEQRREEFLEWAFRYEGRADWQFDSGAQNYSYDRQYGSLRLRKTWGWDRYFNLGASYEKKREELVDSLSPAQNADWLRNQYLLWLQSEWQNGSHWPWSIVAGLQWVRRDWDSSKGEVGQDDLLPHLYFDFPHRRGDQLNRWTLGYEFTVHQAHGPRALRSRHDPNWAVEHRFNAGYEFVFSSKASLKFLGSLDLDRLGTGESWEGGQGSFQMLF